MQRERGSEAYELLICLKQMSNRVEMFTELARVNMDTRFDKCNVYPNLLKAAVKYNNKCIERPVPMPAGQGTGLLFWPVTL